MKKYLSGLIAFIIAIGLSAFTPSGGGPSNKEDDVFYWYIVDYTNNPSGEIPSGSGVQFGGVQTLDYANSNDGCSGNTKDCLRGFTSMPSLPSSASGQAQTRKN